MSVLLEEESAVNDIENAFAVLAATFGIEPEYMDNWGKIHKTSLDAAKKILRAKGVRIDTADVIPQSQVTVVSSDQLPERFLVDIPGRLGPTGAHSGIGPVHVRTIDEKGIERRWDPASDDVHVDAHGDRAQNRLSLPFPRQVEIGAYKVLVETEVGGLPVTAESLWIVCPASAYLPPDLEQGRRIAGVNVALYGVRSERNWGVGDFTDLKSLIDWAADDLRVDFVGLNPLHALFNSSPYNTSPYLPSSRFYRNFLYLDVTAVPDSSESPRAVSMVKDATASGLLRRLRAEEHVNYNEVSRLKYRVLKEVFLSFLENHGRGSRPTERWQRFQDYVGSEGTYLKRFATFSALRERVLAGTPPVYTLQEWPAAFRNPDSAEVESFTKENEDEILFWMYLQWQIDLQLSDVQTYAREKGMLLGLYHDEALAIDRNGADSWAYGDALHDGFSVGAPPDAFAPDGQDWGFAPPVREKAQQSGYELFRARLQANCRHGGALRIDHVMQLRHLFWIPEGGKPADGVYVKDYESDLLNLLALESSRQGTLIVGEDLGTVPFDFRERLMAKGFFSYRLFYFERDDQGNMIPAHYYPENALVSISTHDLPTLAGFWSGRDIDVRVRIGQLNAEQETRFREERTQHKAKIIEKLVQEGDLPAHTAHAAWESDLPTKELHAAVLRFVFRTPSRLAAINQEDIFLDLRQQNVPGTVLENPNWVTKMLFTVEELRSHPNAVQMTERFRDLLISAGRAGR
jgi:4-alpha-glucanotransferase